MTLKLTWDSPLWITSQLQGLGDSVGPSDGFSSTLIEVFI